MSHTRYVMRYVTHYATQYIASYVARWGDSRYYYITILRYVYCVVLDIDILLFRNILHHVVCFVDR